MPDLHFSSSAGQSLAVGHGLLTAVASLVEHGLQGAGFCRCGAGA